MPNVIDSLVVELGLDSRNFTEGQRDALAAFKKTKEGAESFGKSIEREGAKLADIFSIVKKGAVGILGAFIGDEAAGFIDKIAGMDNATARWAKTIGISVEGLSTWQGMIRQIGGQAGSATSAMSGLQSAITNMLQGGGMLEPGAMFLLSQIGGFRGKSMDQIFRELTVLFDKEISAGRQTPTGAAEFLKRLPGMNKDMIDLILKGVEAQNKLRKSIEGVITATDESAARSEDYIEKVSRLYQAWENLGRGVLPVLTTIVNILATLMRQGSAETKKRAGEAMRGMYLFGNEDFGALEMSDARKKLAAELSVRASAAPGSVISVKPDAGTASPAMQKLMAVLSTISGVKEVTALNDLYHALLGGAHPAGRAIDLTISDPTKSAAVAAAIRAKLKELGISANVIDEYAKPSARSTGGHIHVGLSPAGAAAIGGGELPVGAGAAAMHSSSITNNRGGDNRATTSTVYVDKVNVYSQGTDGEGIARDLKPAIERFALAMPANSALV